MRRLVIFSHFDTDDIIDNYVVNYLNALHAISCDIIFVSTSQLADKELERVSDVCISMICRQNIGYDFMSYKTGLFESGINLKAYDEIVICNDSVYGPFSDLLHIFDSMSIKRCDFWGITTTREKSPHLQSFFIVFKRNIFQSEAFRDFFTNITVLNNKKTIIESYEIGLTNWFVSQGFIYDSYCKQVSFFARLKAFLHSFTSLKKLSPKSVRNRFSKIVILDELNPTIFYWKELLQQDGPFLKIELLRKNPLKMKSTASILRYVKNKTQYPTTLIQEHLHRTISKY